MGAYLRLGVVNFFYLLGEHLFGVGAYSRLGV